MSMASSMSENGESAGNLLWLYSRSHRSLRHLNRKSGRSLPISVSESRCVGTALWAVCSVVNLKPVSRLLHKSIIVQRRTHDKSSKIKQGVLFGRPVQERTKLEDSEILSWLMPPDSFDQASACHLTSFRASWIPSVYRVCTHIGDTLCTLHTYRG